MAPNRPATKIPKKTKQLSEEDEESQVSQDSEAEDVARLAQKMMASTKKRRDARRKELTSVFATKAAKMEADITSTFASYDRHQITKAGIDRLGTLLEKKAAIEARILSSVTKLERAYEDINREFSISLTGRAQDLVALPEVSATDSAC